MVLTELKRGAWTGPKTVSVNLAPLLARLGLGFAAETRH